MRENRDKLQYMRRGSLYLTARARRRFGIYMNGVRGVPLAIVCGNKLTDERERQNEAMRNDTNHQHGVYNSKLSAGLWNVDGLSAKVPRLCALCSRERLRRAECVCVCVMPRCVARCGSNASNGEAARAFVCCAIASVSARRASFCILVGRCAAVRMV